VSHREVSCQLKASHTTADTHDVHQHTGRGEQTVIDVEHMEAALDRAVTEHVARRTLRHAGRVRRAA